MGWKIEIQWASNPLKPAEMYPAAEWPNLALLKKPKTTPNFDIALKHYETHTSIKNYIGINNFEYTSIKIQKTLPSQGYHMWHVEKGPGLDYLRRALAFTIYLNDIEEGGETEFLYQSTRVKPKKGRIAIWPASFPYVHRGNPPLSGEKYIMTSWLLFPTN